MVGVRRSNSEAIKISEAVQLLMALSQHEGNRHPSAIRSSYNGCMHLCLGVGNFCTAYLCQSQSSYIICWVCTMTHYGDPLQWFWKQEISMVFYTTDADLNVELNRTDPLSWVLEATLPWKLECSKSKTAPCFAWMDTRRKESSRDRASLHLRHLERILRSEKNW